MNEMFIPNRHRLIFALQALLRQLLANDIETPRPCRTACLLMLSGLSHNSIPAELVRRIYDEQHQDGGWVGPDDTLWALLFLRLLGCESSVSYERGIAFLHQNRVDEFGWGRSKRDIPRIPITGRILHFLPEMCSAKYMEGLLRLWSKERNSLTYKAALTLSALHTAGVDPSDVPLITETIDWLIGQQNDDGGFSPWKGHPVGSDIYCTSIATIGLTQYVSKVPMEILQKALRWTAINQLSNGLWAYHQIEDGAAWGSYAIQRMIAFLKK